MSDSLSHPYEMHAQGGGGFTTFESTEAVALPLMLLAKATLRGANGQRMILEYGSTSAVVEGEGLTELFAHLLSGRVKTLRVGRHAGCAVKVIQILDA
jgi:hypothetical protein